MPFIPAPFPWEELADAHRPLRKDDPRFTGCWADRGGGILCNVWTDDPLGLCERHRKDLIGHGPRGGEEAPPGPRPSPFVGQEPHGAVAENPTSGA